MITLRWLQFGNLDRLDLLDDNLAGLGGQLLIRFLDFLFDLDLFDLLFLYI
jgi:hypothetical protein